MEDKKNNGMLTAIIVLLVLVIVGLVIYIVYSTSSKTECNCDNCAETTVNNDNSEDEEITLKDLVGTYTWSSQYTNDDQTECELTATLILKEDHTATYEYNDCSENVKTTGSYNYIDDEVVYTADNSETIFDVLNKDTLEKQTVLKNKIVRLTK